MNPYLRGVAAVCAATLMLSGCASLDDFDSKNVVMESPEVLENGAATTSHQAKAIQTDFIFTGDSAARAYYLVIETSTGAHIQCVKAHEGGISCDWDHPLNKVGITK